jgi:hypothetical protein
MVVIRPGFKFTPTHLRCPELGSLAATTHQAMHPQIQQRQPKKHEQMQQPQPSAEHPSTSNRLPLTKSSGNSTTPTGHRLFMMAAKACLKS